MGFRLAPGQRRVPLMRRPFDIAKEVRLALKTATPLQREALRGVPVRAVPATQIDVAGQYTPGKGIRISREQLRHPRRRLQRLVRHELGHPLLERTWPDSTPLHHAIMRQVNLGATGKVPPGALRELGMAQRAVQAVPETGPPGQRGIALSSIKKAVVKRRRTLQRLRQKLVKP